jgi:surface protein
MFWGASAFTSDISAWDVSNVTNMEAMFTRAFAFTSDLSAWNVSNVTNMCGMFWGASSFTSDLSTWNVSNVTNMCRMFWAASAFTSDISAWDVSNVTDMAYMFTRAFAFTSDLSAWDVSNVTQMAWMFYDAIAFTGDLSAWIVSPNTTDYNMLVGSGIEHCPSKHPRRRISYPPPLDQPPSTESLDVSAFTGPWRRHLAEEVQDPVSLSVSPDMVIPVTKHGTCLAPLSRATARGLVEHRITTHPTSRQRIRHWCDAKQLNSIIRWMIQEQRKEDDGNECGKRRRVG